MLYNGAWDQWTADKYHASSPMLAGWLAKYLPLDENVIDFGCGNAFYVSELAAVGFNCVGVEGFKLNNFLHDQIIIKDLTEPIDLPIRGSVISLEVGEHLPKRAEQTFLDTITKHCTRHLIISWALPGQPGIGHINCQSQVYITSEIERRGFEFLPMETENARAHVDKNTDWFERTLLIFKRK